jgi:hypothetical protein
MYGELCESNASSFLVCVGIQRLAQRRQSVLKVTETMGENSLIIAKDV